MHEEFTRVIVLSVPLIYMAAVVEIMFLRLQPLVKWPGREELQFTIPGVFRKQLSRCVAIIDCFNVRCSRVHQLSFY